MVDDDAAALLQGSMVCMKHSRHSHSPAIHLTTGYLHSAAKIIAAVRGPKISSFKHPLASLANLWLWPELRNLSKRF
jgi:hypothetical protein